MVRQRSRVQIPAKATFHAQYLNEFGTKNRTVQFTLIPFQCVATPWSTNNGKKLLSTFITFIAEPIITAHTSNCHMPNVTNTSLETIMEEPCYNYKLLHVIRSLARKTSTFPSILDLIRRTILQELLHLPVGIIEKCTSCIFFLTISNISICNYCSQKRFSDSLF